MKKYLPLLMFFGWFIQLYSILQYCPFIPTWLNQNILSHISGSTILQSIRQSILHENCDQSEAPIIFHLPLDTTFRYLKISGPKYLHGIFHDNHDRWSSISYFLSLSLSIAIPKVQLRLRAYHGIFTSRSPWPWLRGALMVLLPLPDRPVLRPGSKGDR